MWAPQRAAFEQQTKVVAVNLPGFGGTQSVGTVMTMVTAADRAVSAARRAGLRHPLVCGLSMGGYVALALWRQHPEFVAGLVLANTKAEADDGPARERRAQLATRLRDEGNAFLVDSPPPLLSGNASPELWARVKASIASQPPNSIAAASLGMAERADSSADLKTITVPTLVISSSNDTLIPPAATKPLAEGIKGARYEVIDGAGHLSNLEAPEQFNTLLKEHFRSVR
jgi:pimeloyl-ACP methyl ester carboxylesterase